MPKLNTQNCSFYFVKKFSSFCRVLKRCTQMKIVFFLPHGVYTQTEAYPFTVDKLVVEEKHDPLLLRASGAEFGQVSTMNQLRTPLDQTRTLPHHRCQLFDASAYRPLSASELMISTISLELVADTWLRQLILTLNNSITLALP